MRKVYICSPYRAKDGAELDRNIDYAQQLTRQALEAGLAPITPHLYMTQSLQIIVSGGIPYSRFLLLQSHMR